MIVFNCSEESTSIRYRLGIGMVSEEEDTRDFSSTNSCRLPTVTDLTGVGHGTSNEVDTFSSETTTDISSMLAPDSKVNQEVHIY